MVNPKIHIFCCGNELGFSLRETGEDLPAQPQESGSDLGPPNWTQISFGSCLLTQGCCYATLSGGGTM